MKKLFFLGAVALLSLVGCDQAAASSDDTSVTITDLVGRKVSVNPGSYKKVVCIGGGALRLYSYIEDAKKLAGVEDIENDSLSNRPKMFDGVARPYFIANKEAYRALPSCGVGGPAAQAAEPEKILDCRPDIILSLYEDVDKANALQEQVGVPVIVLRYGSKGVFDELAGSSITLLGQIFKKENRASELNAYIDACKKDLSDRTSNLSAEESAQKVYICGLGNWGTTNHKMSAKNYEPFNVAHITNICDSALSNPGVQSVDDEVLASLAPDVDCMFFDAAAVKNIKPLYEADPTMFDSFKAWKNGKVYLEMAYNAYYTNLEIALANAYFCAKTVYPAHFEDVDIALKTSEITNKFLGKDLSREIFDYPQSFGGYQQIDTATFFA